MFPETSLRGTRLLLALVLCLVLGSTIVISGYFTVLSLDIRMWLRAGLCILFLAGLVTFKRASPAWHTSMAFFAVSAGLLVDGLLGDFLFDWFPVNREDARGFALSKISETLPIILIILAIVLLSGKNLKEMYLRRGRLGWSLLGGLAVGAALIAYFLTQGGGQVFQAGNLMALLPTIGWVKLFSIFNGFMEELWFRGLFLSRFEWLVGRRWAFWLTVLVFGILHAFGSFTGTIGSALLTIFTLLLGMAFGYIVQKTGSIWGAVLGHFFADFFFLLGYFAAVG